MIRYPLNVTIDSNYFDSTKYDFSKGSTLELLVSYVEENKIKIYLSDIVYREIKKHIQNKAQEVASKARTLRSEILKSVSEDLVNAVDLKYLLQLTDKEAVKQRAADDWENYVNRLQPVMFDYSDISIESILNDYFAFNPPFENNEKKRKEFPDAFIAAQIKKTFKDTETVAIISSDKGFKKACGGTPNYMFFSTLEELFDTINKQENLEYNVAKSCLGTLYASIGSDVFGKIHDPGRVEVFGQSVDYHGVVVDGYEYDEINIVSCSPVRVALHYIDAITEESITATLKCESHIEVDCTFTDYLNSSWDSENREHVNLIERTMREIHDARFAIRVEVNRSTGEYKLSGFKVFLSGDTRKERFEVHNEHDEDFYGETEDMDRESVGLIPFGQYENELESQLQESEFSTEILAIFEEINQSYVRAEEYDVPFYKLLELWEEQDECNKDKLISVVRMVVNNLQGIDGISETTDEESSEYDDWNDFIGWLKEKNKLLTKFSEAKLPDYFQYGDSISIQGLNKEYVFSLDQIHISPSEGSEESIGFSLSGPDNVLIAKGYTKLLVGYLHFDDDGCVDDGLEDEISYYYDEIVAELRKIASEIDEYVSAQQKISEYIDEALETHINNI